MSIRWVRPVVVMTAALSLSLTTVAVGAEETAATQQPLTVRLDTGLVRGSHDGENRIFSGVRYARPPVGALRWKDPVPPERWKGVAKATAPGHECAQFGGADGRQLSGAEDCLFVNVYTPRTPSTTPRPVMVWLHGGGYTIGSGNAYDAGRLAAQGDAVVVTVNYRLGVFGYFGLPGLAGAGGFGLADQIEALRWTQRNAAVFGGDRDNVTVFGNSAGAMSICALLTSPAARGLVDKAIMQSGTCMNEWPSGTLVPVPGLPSITPYSSLRQAHSTSGAAATDLGCPSGRRQLACMRAKSVEDLMPVNDRFASHLSYGTPLLPENPAVALRKGRFLRVPVMSGGTRDENRGFISGAIRAGIPVTASEYPVLMKAAFDAKADQVMARYPLSQYRSAALAWATVGTDRGWACPKLTGEGLLSTRNPVYAYYLTDDEAPNVNGIPQEFPPGAAHASELPYLFDLGGAPWPEMRPEQWKLADQMIMYWTTFARTGDPNAPGTPRWPRFSPTSDTVVSLKPGTDGIRPSDYRAEHRCEFWDEMSR
ncbi:carboxylesterase/lipase family protein [Streptomyces sp. NPDC057638]|uniref:carboxylesterase/lipase family protein n=1 Tax=Streptomyces sp. NPDC057638 TaxID=3346190 RepID=UPI003683223F